MALAHRALVLAAAVVLATVQSAGAQPLRDANDAASAGDWARVDLIIRPLLAGQLSTADRVEAYRLAGLAAYNQQRLDDADRFFFEFLKLDLDGRLDPALYSPLVVSFFEGVRIRHAADLRARRPTTRKWMALNLLPPAGQFQNGDRRKAWILGGTLTGLLAVNVTTFFTLRSWCTRVVGDGGQSDVCDGHEKASRALNVINIVSGIGFLVGYVYGVYDGVTGLRRLRRSELVPYVQLGHNDVGIGVGGRF